MDANGESARIAELEEDNRRLRRLLDQRDAPGELRHRLRSTLGLLRAIIRRSAGTARERQDFAAHLEDRFDALARAQAMADRNGEINLHGLVSDELFHYRLSEGQDGLALSGPPVWLTPKAGQVFALAVHELAVNAVEHGELGSGQGRLEIAWTVGTQAEESLLSFVWREFGARAETGPEGFGTEVLTRMLPFELKARTDLVFGPDRVECRIAFPLTGTNGRSDEF